MAPKSNSHLINKETSGSNGDLMEYPVKMKSHPRVTLHRGTKITTKLVPSPKKTIRMKHASTSSLHSALSSEDVEDNENIVAENEVGASKSSSYETDSKNKSLGTEDMT